MIFVIEQDFITNLICSIRNLSVFVYQLLGHLKMKKRKIIIYS